MSTTTTDDSLPTDSATGATSKLPVAPASNEEKACTSQWMDKLKAGRKFDENQRSEYALNRRYLKGNRGDYAVDVPIAPAYVDVLQSFIFARNPSVNCGASALTEPPPTKEILATAMQQVSAQRQQQAAAMNEVAQHAQALTANTDPAQVAALAEQGRKVMAASGAGQDGGPMAAPGPNPNGDPSAPIQAPPVGEDDPQVRAAVAAFLAPYQRQRDNAKQFAQTMEIVITKTWQRALLKKRGKMMVKSSLSVGVGWLKAFWLNRTEQDPTTQTQIDDLQRQLAQIATTKRELDAGEAANVDATRATLQQQVDSLQASLEQVVERCFIIDFVAAEDIQVSTEIPSLELYNEANWIAHRSFPTVEQAKVDYPAIAGRLNQATKYRQRQPANTTGQDTGYAARLEGGPTNPRDADQFTTGGDDSTGGTTASGEEVIARWEVWDRITGDVLTLIEGIDQYAKPPFTPEYQTTKGHPFFLYGIGFVDGSRHPRSMISRSEKLLDEYNAARTNWREARRRAIPKTAYDKEGIEAKEITKLTIATYGEMVGIERVNPQMPLKDLLVPIAYNPIDQALFDTAPIRAELETIWGIQEALSSSIRTAKTATEAEIQQTGTNSRTGYMSDDLDAMFEELAIYTAEICLQAMTVEDVQELAGPYAMWPENLTLANMHQLLTIEIDAGSAGKPKTALMQQAWAALLPLLQNTIKEIGQLRGSSPEEIADCLEEVIQETIRRSGDRLDASQFLPDAPAVPPPAPQPTPPPAADGAMMGPQVQELLATLNEVKAGALDPEAATAVIAATYPGIPEDLRNAMVESSKPVIPRVAPTQSRFEPPPPPAASASATANEGAPA